MADKRARHTVRGYTVTVAAAIAILTHLSLIRAQSGPTGKPATYGAAVLKSNKDNDGQRRAGFQAGGRFIGVNVTVSMLIGAAFSTPDAMWPGFQVTGGPAWINTDGYDVQAKTDGNTPPEDQRLMLRNLLGDRFKLTTHIETRDLPTYSLVLVRTDARLGPQLHPSAGDCIYGNAANPSGLPHCEDRFGEARLKARRLSVAATTMDGLALQLQSRVGRKVVNRTGLPGTFDADLEFNYVTPPATALVDQSADGLSIFTALEDQLGLRLSADHGPVEMLVIDHIERPSED
jgi:uncharacterized protein (TIGR03435 family)